MLTSKNAQKAMLALLGVGIATAIGAAIWWLKRHTVSLLQPAGPVGHDERQLMYYAAALGLIVIIPVYLMTFIIAVKYREGNKKHGKYAPNFDGHKGIELTWWAIPMVIIGVLAVLTWRSAHQLDPYKPLASNKKPLHVQVVSLDWKWLFIYPDQHIATVNFLEIPQSTPVTFDVTSGSVMNSFWIPQLGGQIYSMPGMNSQLHLQGDTLGDYRGSSANISGKGFSGMTFTTRVSTVGDFSNWVNQTQRAPVHLDQATYNKLAKPSENNPVTYYSQPMPALYETIVHKYMGH